MAGAQIKNTFKCDKDFYLMHIKNQNPKVILECLMELLRKYSFTYRAIVTEERYVNLVQSGIIQDIDYTSKKLREPLIEHVGCLPIVASFLHEFIENRARVNLEKVLAILSIHDIGETEVGDVFAFGKTDIHAQLEYEAAKKYCRIINFSTWKNL